MVRTAFLMAIVLSIGVMMTLFAGSGFNALVTGSQSPGQLSERIQGQADESTLNDDQNITSDRTGSSGSVAGLVLSSARRVGNVIGLVSMLPITLQRLGFPRWFALPVGSVVYIIAGLGLVQFLSGRIFR